MGSSPSLHVIFVWQKCWSKRIQFIPCNPSIFNHPIYVQCTLYMLTVYFWYLVKSDLSSVHMYSSINWTSHFLKGTRKKPDHFFFNWSPCIGMYRPICHEETNLRILVEWSLGRPVAILPPSLSEIIFTFFKNYGYYIKM